MTALDDGTLAHCGVLICDRDRKWSAPVHRLLEESAVRVVQTPFQAPNCKHTRSASSDLLKRSV